MVKNKKYADTINNVNILQEKHGREGTNKKNFSVMLEFTEKYSRSTLFQLCD